VSQRRRALLVALAAIAGACALPASAFAHAQLEETSPQRGAVVARQPAQVVFRFDETVEGNFGAVRVFDAKGARVDSGDAFHPSGRGSEMAVHLKPGLAQGTYTATYRVVSADGHIVSSGFSFSVGHASAAGQTVAELTGGAGSGAVTEVAFGIARGLQFLAIAIAVGALAFLLLVWPAALGAVAGGAPAWATASQAFVARLRRLLGLAALAGLVSAAAAVVLEGAEAAGVSGFDALRSQIVRETLGTRFGTFWGLAALAWLLLGAGTTVLLAARRAHAPALRAAELGATGLALGGAPRGGAGRALAVLALPAGYLLLMPALSGHGTSQSPVAVLLPANVLHVASMSVWVGGLAVLLLALPAATRRLEGGDRGRLLAAVLVRFSPLALGAVIAILVTGLVQSYVLVRTPAHLLDTAFGRAALIKFLLLLGLIGLGAYQRRRSVPRLARIAADGASPGATGVLLRRALRGELALIVCVLGVTAALTGYAPSIAAQSGPFSTTTTVGPAQLQLTLDPARVGSNELHLYLLKPRDGSQFTGAKEVAVAETQPQRSIGPLTQQANVAGPGHYVVPAATFGVPGTWQVQVTVRVSDFDEYTRKLEVKIR
jgi:copper transport protein